MQVTFKQSACLNNFDYKAGVTYELPAEMVDNQFYLRLVESGLIVIEGAEAYVKAPPTTEEMKKGFIAQATKLAESTQTHTPDEAAKDTELEDDSTDIEFADDKPKAKSTKSKSKSKK